MGGHVGTKGTHGGAVEVYVRHGDESHIRGGLGHALHIPKRLGVRDDLKRVNHIHGKQGIHSSFTRWEANQLVATQGQYACEQVQWHRHVAWFTYLGHKHLATHLALCHYNGVLRYDAQIRFLGSPESAVSVAVYKTCPDTDTHHSRNVHLYAT